MPPTILVVIPEQVKDIILPACFNSLLYCMFSQTRQPVFVQLLQAVFRVYHCNWLIPIQKGSVESCIKVLSDVGKIQIVRHVQLVQQLWFCRVHGVSFACARMLQPKAEL